MLLFSDHSRGHIPQQELWIKAILRITQLLRVATLHHRVATLLPRVATPLLKVVMPLHRVVMLPLKVGMLLLSKVVIEVPLHKEATHQPRVMPLHINSKDITIDLAGNPPLLLMGEFSLTT